MPEREYTNQSETANSMLAAKKVRIGYSKKEDISKSHFIRHIWQEVVDEQNADIDWPGRKLGRLRHLRLL